MSVSVEPIGEQTEQRVEATDVGGVEDHGDEHDEAHATHFRPLRPGDLAHLIADLADVLDRSRALLAGLLGRLPLDARGLALLVEGAHLAKLSLLFSIEIV